jgi:hypothetical protein
MPTMLNLIETYVRYFHAYYHILPENRGVLLVMVAISISLIIGVIGAETKINQTEGVFGRNSGVCSIHGYQCCFWDKQ